MFLFAALNLPTVHWKIPGTHTVLDFKELVVIGGAVVIAILIVVFLLVARRGSEKNAVTKLLSGANPAERIAGVKLAANEGLGRHVRVLRHVAGSEKNPQVLKELAEVVARHQWEPSDDADVVELHVWAHRYYADRLPVRGSDGKAATPGARREVPAAERAPNVARSSIPVVTMPAAADPPVVAVPLPPVETVASYGAPEAAGAFTVLELARRRELAKEASLEGGETSPVVPEEPPIPSAPVADEPEVAPPTVTVDGAPPLVVAPEEPMLVPDVAPEEPMLVPDVAPEEPMLVPDDTPFEATPPPFVGDKPCILVTGAGGAAGVTVIRALMAAGYRVVALDTDPLAVGLRLAHASQMIPSADDPQFSAFLCKLSIHQGAKAVISTVAEEMSSLSSHQELFDADHIATWFPERGVVQTCIDKWLFYLAAKSAGLPVPPTNLGSAEGVPGPWIVKPRFGRGSRNIMWVDTPEDLAWALGKVPSALAQTRLLGQEFTVDALIARDGALAGAVPRWRLQTGGGITTKDETFTNESLIRLVEHLLRGLALRGAANVQGFISKDGSTMFTEVNPKFSGGLALSLAAGADLVGQYVNGVFNLPIDPARLRYRSGVRMLRYFDEVFEG